MSAFILNKKHVDVLVDYANRHGLCPKSLDEIGQIIVDENFRSFNYRYQEKYPPHTYKWEHPIREYTPIEIIKAAQCADYQLCENRDYDDSEAAGIIYRIKIHAISCLHGYEEAAWEIN